MGDTTGIEWTDSTWNPVRGCTRVSEGCRNCYAERIAARFSGPGKPFEGLAQITKAGARWTGKAVLVPEALDHPLRWRKPRRVFVNSMSDLFHESLSNTDIDRVFAVMAMAREHTFQVLTKRPERMRAYFDERRDDGYTDGILADYCSDRNWRYLNGLIDPKYLRQVRPWVWPIPNVWLGVSVEDQATADERIPLLLETPAAVRFLSCEPLLGPIDFGKVPGFNKAGSVGQEAVRNLWVIAGGESGPGARPSHPDWFRRLRNQCVNAGVPFFFKQWGRWAPIDQPWKQDVPEHCSENERWLNLAGGWGFHGQEVWRMRSVGKAAAGRILDGQEWNQMPDVRAAGATV